MLEKLLELARVFDANGYELYMVGGTVRDLLMRREHSPDVDLTTNARPDEIKRLANLTNPTALVSVGEQFGTIRLHYRRPEGAPADEPGAGGIVPAAVASHPADEDVIEITTYRSDVYSGDSRKPAVTFGESLAGDLLRRDFTINAMARNPLSGEIIDLCGGNADLERQLIRAVGDEPEQRFDEDPLRMLRAARFAAQLGFAIEERTARAMARQAGTLAKISTERIRDEFTKLLMTPNPATGIRLLADLGLMPFIVPEVLELRGVSQQPAGRSKEVYEHVLRVVERTPPRAAVRWAGLLHDIAKPRTRSFEGGQVHFYGHEDVGAVMARDILRRLKFDRPFIEYVTRLVKLHMRANAYQPEWTDGAVRRLMLDAGDALPDLLDLSRADITSYRPDKLARAAARTNELEERTRVLREEAERVPLRSPLDGNDLMTLFGRGPGPWLRPLKEYLLGLVLDGQLAAEERERAEELARAYMAREAAGKAETAVGEAEAEAEAEARAGRDAAAGEQQLGARVGKRRATPRDGDASRSSGDAPPAGPDAPATAPPRSGGQ
ncbi:MAG: CCA tRNA nucleotidyltransferase [Ktedonobacterales bacterium]